MIAGIFASASAGRAPSSESAQRKPIAAAAPAPLIWSAIAAPEFAEARRVVLGLLHRHGMHFAEGDGNDAPEAMTGQLDKRIRPAGAKWIAQIRAAVDAAESLDDLEQRLFDLAPGMDLDEYARAFAEAMAAAQLAGRQELMQA